MSFYSEKLPSPRSINFKPPWESTAASSRFATLSIDHIGKFGEIRAGNPGEEFPCSRNSPKVVLSAHWAGQLRKVERNNPFSEEDDTYCGGGRGAQTRGDLLVAADALASIAGGGLRKNGFACDGGRVRPGLRDWKIRGQENPEENLGTH